MNELEYWAYTPTQYEKYLTTIKAANKLINDKYLANSLNPALKKNEGLKGLLVDILTPQLAKPFAAVDLDNHQVFWLQRKESLYKRLNTENLIITSNAANASQMSLESLLKALHVDNELKPVDDYFEYDQARFDFKQMLNVESMQSILSRQYPELDFSKLYTVTVTDTLFDPLITRVHRVLGKYYPKDEELQVALIRLLFDTSLVYRVSLMEFNPNCMTTIQVPAPNMIPHVLSEYLNPGRYRLELWHNHQFKRIDRKDLFDIIREHKNAENIIPFIKEPGADIRHYQTQMELKYINPKTQKPELDESINFAINSGHPAKLDEHGQMLELYGYDEDHRLIVKPVKNSGVYLIDLDRPHTTKIVSEEVEIKIPATKKPSTDKNK